jgi:hypothetical protein
MKRPFLLFIFFLSNIPVVAQANTANWWETPKTRQAHAAKDLRDFRALYDKIPTLSPAEERWLKTEYDDTIAANAGRYTERAVNVMNSREWDIRIAKPHALMIDHELSQLAMPLDSTEETEHWARLATLLIDHQFWEAVEDLQQRDVLDKKALDFMGKFPEPTATLRAEQILNVVVVPYFDNKH